MRAERDAVWVPWAARKYAAAMPARPTDFASPAEDRLSQLFPALHAKPYPVMAEPCIVVDRNGLILAWYLPDTLTAERQAS